MVFSYGSPSRLIQGVCVSAPGTVTSTEYVFNIQRKEVIGKGRKKGGREEERDSLTDGNQCLWEKIPKRLGTFPLRQMLCTSQF